MKNSLAKRLMREREISVDLFHSAARWGAMNVLAKVDTGADRSSIDSELAAFLEWEVTGERTVRSANGRQVREYGTGLISIAGSEFVLDVTFADRSEMSHVILIGCDLIDELLDLSEEE